MKARGVFSFLDRMLAVLCIAFVAAIVILVLLQVFSRYVLQLPIQGVEELARLVFVWACFSGAALASLRHENIAVTFLAQRISPPLRNWMNLILELIIAGLSAIMLIKGTTYVIDKWMYPDYNTALLYPRSLFWLPVPFAGAIIFAKSLSLIVQRIRDAAKR
jgi:TRAP-type transport system small permease protein